MVKIGDGRYVIGFDDGYQLGKTANYIFDNGVHMLGSVEPTLKENSLFYEGEYFKVGEGRAAITEDKVSSDAAMLRTMAAIAMELGSAGIRRAEVVLAVGLPVRYLHAANTLVNKTDIENTRKLLERLAKEPPQG